MRGGALALLALVIGSAVLLIPAAFIWLLLGGG